VGVSEMPENVEEWTKAVEDRSKLHRIIDELRRLIDRGRLHLLAWREVYKIARSEGELVDLATGFFWMTAVAHFDAAILQAAKLIDAGKDSVNFAYFFNVLLNESRKYFPNNWDEVKKSVQADQNRLSSIRDDFQQVKGERDRLVAHLDRKVVNSGLDEETRVKAEELEKLFDTFEQLLHPYYAYYGLSTPIDLCNQTMFSMSLDDLFYLVRKALDGEPIGDASESIKKVQSWRRARLWVERSLIQAQSGNFPDSE